MNEMKPCDVCGTMILEGDLLYIESGYRAGSEVCGTCFDSIDQEDD